jgi:hypothetical protein
MSMNVDGTMQGVTQVQELEHWCWTVVGGRKPRNEIDIDGTIQGETQEQEMKDRDWARVEKHCKADKVPAYEASVQYNKFYFI